MDNELKDRVRSVIRRGCPLREERVAYFTAAAGILISEGVPMEQAISVIANAQGDYLLGKKYGVTPELFASNVMDYVLKK